MHYYWRPNQNAVVLATSPTMKLLSFPNNLNSLILLMNMLNRLMTHRRHVDEVLPYECHHLLFSLCVQWFCGQQLFAMRVYLSHLDLLVDFSRQQIQRRFLLLQMRKRNRKNIFKYLYIKALIRLRTFLKIKMTKIENKILQTMTSHIDMNIEFETITWESTMHKSNSASRVPTIKWEFMNHLIIGVPIKTKSTTSTNDQMNEHSSWISVWRRKEWRMGTHFSVWLMTTYETYMYTENEK